MKKSKYLVLILTGLVLAACGPPGKEAKLAKLERQRDMLNEKIDLLKQSMAMETSPKQKPEKVINVKASPLEKGLFQHFIQVQGTIESDNNILVAPQASGVVKKIHVAAGNRVKQGQILAELDGSILESSIAEVENGLALARTIFERQQRLWNKKIGSEIEFLQAKNNKEGLEGRLATLQEQYKLTKIFSPLSGTVDEVRLKEGEMAAAGMGAFRVVQLSNLKIVVDLSEVYITRIKKGDKVFVSIPVIGKEFEQNIAAVSQVIDPDNRTFQVEIKIPKSERNIKPNMLAALTINDYSNTEALTVPISIVQETETEKFIFIASEVNGEWIARKRIVTTGENNAGQIEILNGAEQGEQVITLGYQNLADGQKISITMDN